MGVKRSLDENTFQEFPFKQAKQLDGNNKPAEIVEDISPDEVSQTAAIPYDYDSKVGESEFFGKPEEDKADKELETSANSSWVTSSSGEEEGGDGGAYFLPIYPDFMDFNLPRQPSIQVEDPYSYLLNSSPKKDVPLGPDYQADIPEFDPDAFKKDSLRSHYRIDYGMEQKLVGSSINAMPDSIVSSCDDVKVGRGRVDCDCSDKGSIRCVRQHIGEAREQLRETMGNQKFEDLGFLDMGEEVALKWTEKEEQIFHEVVYSNPVSVGKNFWKHLTVAFPTRTKMEVVSYYFNAFILQKRAVQNRSAFLDIDSDDDEWQEEGRFPSFGGEEDSVVDSFGDEDLQADGEIGMSYEVDDDNEDDDGNDDDDDDNNNGDEGTNGHSTTDKADQEERMSKQLTEMSKEYSGFGSNFHNMGRVVSSDCKVHDTIQENLLRSENLRCYENEDLGSGFVLDPCDARAWDDTFLTSQLRSSDFLPTGSMIEEIFGPCSWKNN